MAQPLILQDEAFTGGLQRDAQGDAKRLSVRDLVNYDIVYDPTVSLRRRSGFDSVTDLPALPDPVGGKNQVPLQMFICHLDPSRYESTAGFYTTYGEGRDLVFIKTTDGRIYAYVMGEGEDEAIEIYPGTTPPTDPWNTKKTPFEVVGHRVFFGTSNGMYWTDLSHLLDMTTYHPNALANIRSFKVGIDEAASLQVMVGSSRICNVEYGVTAGVPNPFDVGNQTSHPAIETDGTAGVYPNAINVSNAATLRHKLGQRIHLANHVRHADFEKKDVYINCIRLYVAANPDPDNQVQAHTSGSTTYIDDPAGLHVPNNGSLGTSIENNWSNAGAIRLSIYKYNTAADTIPGPLITDTSKNPDGAVPASNLLGQSEWFSLSGLENIDTYKCGSTIASVGNEGTIFYRLIPFVFTKSIKLQGLEDNSAIIPQYHFIVLEGNEEYYTANWTPSNVQDLGRWAIKWCHRAHSWTEDDDPPPPVPAAYDTHNYLEKWFAKPTPATTLWTEDAGRPSSGASGTDWGPTSWIRRSYPLLFDIPGPEGDSNEYSLSLGNKAHVVESKLTATVKAVKSISDFSVGSITADAFERLFVPIIIPGSSFTNDGQITTTSVYRKLGTHTVSQTERDLVWDGSAITAESVLKNWTLGTDSTKIFSTDVASPGQNSITESIVDCTNNFFATIPLVKHTISGQVLSDASGETAGGVAQPDFMKEMFGRLWVSSGETLHYSEKIDEGGAQGIVGDSIYDYFPLTNKITFGQPITDITVFNDNLLLFYRNEISTIRGTSSALNPAPDILLEELVKTEGTTFPGTSSEVRGNLLLVTQNSEVKLFTGGGSLIEVGDTVQSIFEEYNSIIKAVSYKGQYVLLVSGDELIILDTSRRLPEPGEAVRNPRVSQPYWRRYQYPNGSKQVEQETANSVTTTTSTLWTEIVDIGVLPTTGEVLACMKTTKSVHSDLGTPNDLTDDTTTNTFKGQVFKLNTSDSDYGQKIESTVETHSVPALLGREKWSRYIIRCNYPSTIPALTVTATSKEGTTSVKTITPTSSSDTRAHQGGLRIRSEECRLKVTSSNDEADEIRMIGFQ